MKKGFLNKTIILFLILLQISVLCSKVYASGGVTVNQTRVILKADGSESDKKTCITLYNTSDEKMDISLKSADFVIARDGAFQVKELGSQPSSAKGYFNFDEQSFTIDGNSSKSFSVSLAEGKEYNLPEVVSAILVKYSPITLRNDHSTIKTYTQIAVSVRVLAGSKLVTSVDMNITPLEISKIKPKMFYSSGGDKQIPVTFKNIGKITVEPNVSATLSSALSDEVASVPMGLGFVLAGNERTYVANISPKSIFDLYTLTIKADYTYNGKNYTAEKKCRFIVLSYQLLIGLLMALLGIIVQSALHKRKIRQLKTALQQQEIS